MTLVWTDPAAQPLDNTPLINNLDLEVSVDGAQPSAGNGAIDTTNTVEQVSRRREPWHSPHLLPIAC